jgi:hypothetical protein
MSFFRADGDRFLATEYTRGPWSAGHQHGGPPAALLAGAIEAAGPNAEAFSVARIWYEILAPIPIGPVTVSVETVHEGRTAQRVRGVLSAGGREVMIARGLRIRRVQLALPERPEPTWPSLSEGKPFVLPFFDEVIAYHRAIELRHVHGEWGGTPIGFWARPTQALVEGRETRPLERLVLLADAQSGMGLPLDPAVFSFVNPDLSIFLERPPEGEWFGFDIRSVGGAHGSGLSQSALRDARGHLGRSAQTLVIWRR